MLYIAYGISTYMCIYMKLYIYTYKHIYIYVYIERDIHVYIERDRERDINMLEHVPLSSPTAMPPLPQTLTVWAGLPSDPKN